MSRSRHPGASVTIIDPSAVSLKVPSWMLSPDAATYGLSDTATMAPRALLALADLLQAQLAALSGKA